MFFSSRIHWPKLNSNENLKVAISSKRDPPFLALGAVREFWNLKENVEIPGFVLFVYFIYLFILFIYVYFYFICYKTLSWCQVTVMSCRSQSDTQSGGQTTKTLTTILFFTSVEYSIHYMRYSIFCFLTKLSVRLLCPTSG